MPEALLIALLAIIVGFAIFKILLFSGKDTGEVGETVVTLKLNWLSKEYITLNDIMLPTQYGTTQVDHIVVSPYGIFVIETKNYKGYIIGHENSKEWKQSLLGKKTFWGWTSQQFKFMNPILQNKTHCIAIQRLFPELEDYQIIPIIVFSDQAELNISTPNHIVINWRYLRCTIKEFNLPRISEGQVNHIVKTLKNANIKGEEAREKHISSVQDIQQRKLAKELKIENRICPICNGTLIQRNGKFGPFLGCSNYPNCKFTHKL